MRTNSAKEGGEGKVWQSKKPANQKTAAKIPLPCRQHPPIKGWIERTIHKTNLRTSSHSAATTEKVSFVGTINLRAQAPESMRELSSHYKILDFELEEQEYAELYNRPRLHLSYVLACRLRHLC
jgi:hypothetical protein